MAVSLKSAVLLTVIGILCCVQARQLACETNPQSNQTTQVDNYRECVRNTMGTVVRDVDLATASVTEINKIISAVHQHGMIVVKNQSLTPDTQWKFTERLGSAIILPKGLFVSQVKEYPGVTRIGNVDLNDHVIKNCHLSEYWHQDGEFNHGDRVNVWSILHALEIPRMTGATAFLDAEQAIFQLPSHLLTRARSCIYRLDPHNITDFNREVADFLPTVHHNVVRRHYVTGKEAIYLGTIGAPLEVFCGGDMSEQDWEMRSALIENVQKEENWYVHYWEQGDVVIWDNTMVFHRSMGGYGNLRRRLHRTQARMYGLF